MLDISAARPEDLWYTVGLIASDGNLSKTGRHVNITSKDIDLLEDVKKALLITNKISMKGRGSKVSDKIYGALQICSVDFYRFLQSVGLTERKSLTIGELDVPDKYFRDFLRGVIDGDGCIRNWIHRTNGYRQWSVDITSGSLSFVTWLAERCLANFCVEGRLHSSAQHRNNFIYEVKFGKIAAGTLLKECYYPGCLCLERKNKLAMQFIEPNSRIRHYNIRSPF